MAGQPVDNMPLMQMEKATINTCFAREKHYFLSMRNIKLACFTALDASVNDAFKVSNDPTIQGWHAGMQVIDILDQLSTIYGQPTPAVLETNNTVFCSPTQPLMLLKSSSAASKNVSRRPSLAAIPAQIGSL